MRLGAIMKEIVFDVGHEETEELLKQTEKRIENVYRQAYKELKKKSDDYMAQFLKTDAEKRKAMQAGEITKEEYRQWRQSHLLTGRRWFAMQESLAKDLNNSNKIAASVINGHLPDVYAININWATFQLEHDFKIDTSFTLYDRQTMERLLRDDPDLLPWQANINTPEDIRYQKRHLNSAMMQGILQGETIPQIAERLASSPCRMNARNAVTNARTMYTSAQNGGRIDGYKRAEGMGIHLKKQWLATLDGRTRHEHRQLDGQIVGTDESFEVDGYEIEFPGDPKAAAEMVYNCRCTMRSVLDALDKGGYTEYEKNGKLGDMSYEEWKNEHSKASAEDNSNIYYKPINIQAVKEGEHGYTEQDIELINKRFKELDKKYHAKVSEITDTLTEAQSQWDRDVKVRTEYLMQERGYGKRKAENMAKGMFGERPSKVSIFEGGTFNYETNVMCLNPMSIFTNGGINADIESKAKLRIRNEKRLLEGKRPRENANVVSTPEGTFIHEYGHAIDATYNVRNHPKFKELYRQYNKEKIEYGVSSYAAENDFEFIAECFADSYLREEQGEISKKFMKILEEIINDTTKITTM